MGVVVGGCGSEGVITCNGNTSFISDVGDRLVDMNTHCGDGIRDLQET